LNSKRSREKPTHIFYHNLNICFINGINWWRIQRRASNLVQKLIALKFKQKVLIFREKITHLNSWVVTIVIIVPQISALETTIRLDWSSVPHRCAWGMG
jgi:hypothetical protein